MLSHAPFSCRSLICLLLINGLLRMITIRYRGIRIGRGSWVKCKCAIGHGTSLGTNCVIRGGGKLEVGKYCAIGESVRVITSNHDTDRLSMNYLVQDNLVGARFMSEKIDVTVGNDVWIGDGVIILPGVVIGDGAVIGAGSVVTKPVDPYTIVAGNPARILRKRFSPALADRISRMAWWNWDEKERRKNARLFSVKCSENTDQFDGPERSSEDAQG